MIHDDPPSTASAAVAQQLVESVASDRGEMLSASGLEPRAVPPGLGPCGGLMGWAGHGKAAAADADADAASPAVAPPSASKHSTTRAGQPRASSAPRHAGVPTCIQMHTCAYRAYMCMLAAFPHAGECPSSPAPGPRKGRLGRRGGGLAKTAAGAGDALGLRACPSLACRSPAARLCARCCPPPPRPTPATRLAREAVRHGEPRTHPYAAAADHDSQNSLRPLPRRPDRRLRA